MMCTHLFHSDSMCRGKLCNLFQQEQPDHTGAGPEHAGDASNIARPSYCVLPMFHAPRDPSSDAPGAGYISNDGHQFSCPNPVAMQQAYHMYVQN